VGNDLVPVEVEVDPVRRGSSFRAAKEATVEGAGGFEVGYGKRQVKGRSFAHRGILYAPRAVLDGFCGLLLCNPLMPRPDTGDCDD